MNKKKGNQVETEPNWHNRTIWTNDCYYVLNGMNSNCVDMIYMDPPFNKKKNFVAPIGSKAAGAEFKDMWSYDDVKRAALRQIENKHKAVYNVVLAAMNEDDRAFLLYMAPIVMHCERVLKRDTGSFWLHCDHTMASHLKLLCDAIFGRKNFRNDVVWYYTNRMPSGATRKFDDMYDNLLFYAGKNSVFNRQRTDEYTNMMKKAIEDGYWDSDKRKQGKKKVLRIIDKKNPKAKRMLKRQEEYDDVDKNYKPKRKVACSVWDDIGALVGRNKEKEGVQTQKPLKLLERIIQSSTNRNDLVLDPFCGSGTTLIAAERLGRQWTGIDIGRKGVEYLLGRLVKDTYLEVGGNKGLLESGKVTAREEPPYRNDIPKARPLGNGKYYRETRQKLYNEQKGCCNGCKEHFPNTKNMEVDHIVPKGKGGTDHIHNLQLLCGHCNRTKGDRVAEAIRQELGGEVPTSRLERYIGEDAGKGRGRPKAGFKTRTLDGWVDTSADIQHNGS